MKKLLLLAAALWLMLAPALCMADATVAEGMLLFSDADYACYTGAELGGKVTKMSAKARFFGGGACALIATPNLPDSVAAITGCSVHIVFDAHGYYLGFCRDGEVKDVKTGAYTLDLTGEKEYAFGWEIKGRTITLTLPTGKKVKYTGDAVVECGGGYAVWEHYMTESDKMLGTGPAFTLIEGAGETALHDDFSAAEGELTVAPTGQAYICFAN